MYPQVPHRTLKTECAYRPTESCVITAKSNWKRAQRPANLTLHLQWKKEIPEGEGTCPRSPWTRGRAGLKPRPLDSCPRLFSGHMSLGASNPNFFQGYFRGNIWLPCRHSVVSPVGTVSPPTSVDFAITDMVGQLYCVILYYKGLEYPWILFLKTFFWCGTFLKSSLSLLQYCFSCLYSGFFGLEGMWDLSCLTRNPALTFCTGRQSLNHRTTRKVPARIWVSAGVSWNQSPTDTEEQLYSLLYLAQASLLVLSYPLGWGEGRSRKVKQFIQIHCSLYLLVCWIKSN